MNITRFILVGENIHCTRSYKVDGPNVKKIGENKYAILYRDINNQQKLLPVPEHFVNTSDWQSGKAKHCAIAIWMGLHGNHEEKSLGTDYIKALAYHQQQNGASYLDINVDEFSQNLNEQLNAISWTVETVQSVSTLPVCIDSSNCRILEVGLSLCKSDRGRPMLNSVSLERTESIKIARKYNAVVIVSAAGEKGLPSGVDDRLSNIEKIIQKLFLDGFQLNDIHVDPLVLPISTDTNNGVNFLNAVRAIRDKYGQDIHIVAGLSNVSFGLPNRKLINQVFTHLAVEAGADGGILDPSQVNLKVLNAMDTNSEAYILTREMLLGKDEFCTNFIIACREGKI